MSKLVALALAAVLLLHFEGRQNDQFLKYKAVEAYEIRPGTLMMPRYSENGEVCEIGLERRHYSPEEIRLDSTLSREEVNQIAEELVPTNERGPKTKGVGGGDNMSMTGHGIITTSAYENVSIEIYSNITSDISAPSRRARLLRTTLPLLSSGRIGNADRAAQSA